MHFSAGNGRYRVLLGFAVDWTTNRTRGGAAVARRRRRRYFRRRCRRRFIFPQVSDDSVEEEEEEKLGRKLGNFFVPNPEIGFPGSAGVGRGRGGGNSGPAGVVAGVATPTLGG